MQLHLTRVQQTIAEQCLGNQKEPVQKISLRGDAMKLVNKYPSLDKNAKSYPRGMCLYLEKILLECQKSPIKEKITQYSHRRNRKLEIFLDQGPDRLEDSQEGVSKTQTQSRASINKRRLRLVPTQKQYIKIYQIRPPKSKWFPFLTPHCKIWLTHATNTCLTNRILNKNL